MSKTAFAFTLPLLLATALVTWQILSLHSSKSMATPGTHSTPRQVVSDFYDAVNSTLETGDPSGLRSVLHSSFVDYDYSAGPREQRTALDLENDLLALRSVFPDMRFVASTIVTERALVAASVSIEGDLSGSIEGDLPVELETPPSGYALLRIQHGKIVARWTSVPVPEAPESLTTVALPPLAAAIGWRTPRLERLTLDRFASLEMYSDAGVILVVESGAINGYGAQTTSSDDVTIIPAGEARAFAPLQFITLDNTELQPATILVLTIPFFDPAHETGYDRPPVPLPDGVTSNGKVAGPVIEPRFGPFAVSLRLLEIPAGVSIPSFATDTPRLILVTHGNIETKVDNGEATNLSGFGSTHGYAGNVVLTSGEGISGLEGSAFAYRATGSASSTIVLVEFDFANPPNAI